MDFRLLDIPVHLNFWHLLFIGSQYALTAAVILLAVQEIKKLPTPSKGSFLLCWTLAFFMYPVSFLVHEYGHALADREWFGMHVTVIETTPGGFITRADETRAPEKLPPETIITISLAGPLAGMGFSLLFVLAGYVLPRGRMTPTVKALGWNSFLYHALNLAPGYGDGYWILQSVKKLYFS